MNLTNVSKYHIKLSLWFNVNTDHVLLQQREVVLFISNESSKQYSYT